jgi:hypothetical protein
VYAAKIKDFFRSFSTLEDAQRFCEEVERTSACERKVRSLIEEIWEAGSLISSLQSEEIVDELSHNCGEKPEENIPECYPGTNFPLIRRGTKGTVLRPEIAIEWYTKHGISEKSRLAALKFYTRHSIHDTTETNNSGE